MDCETKQVFKLALVVTLFFGLFAQRADARWNRSYSVEWWTNISDTVLVAEVSSTGKVEHSHDGWESQEILCTSELAIKGLGSKRLSFRQDYPVSVKSGWFDVPLRPKERLLLFCVGNNKIIFWINLTKPDAKLARHACYDNECRWMDKGESILALVKRRIANETPQNRRKRGVIVGFTGIEVETYWDFVRTTDPDYKATLLEELRHGDKESAIYNLVSYPGKESVQLIRPFLVDPTTSELEVNDGTDHFKTVKIYHLRQAAYSALKLLGESPERPEGFYPDPFLWLFVTGFEDELRFPHGDWKRSKR